MSLGEVCDAPLDLMVPAPGDLRPYVALEHLAQGTPRLLGWSHAESAYSTKAVFRRGDILFGKLRPNLRKAVRAPFDGVCSTDILVLRGRPSKLVKEYLEHIVHWPEFQSYAVNTASGTKMPRTSWNALSQFTWSLPPIVEQEKIAAVLSSLDEVDAATQTVIEQLQAMKEAMLAELLTHGTPARHSRFNASALGPIPETWEIQELGELGCEGEPTIRSGPFGSSMKTKDFRQEGTPVLTIQSLGQGRITREGLFYVDREKALELSEYSVREGDLVFSRVADIGRSVAIEKEHSGWLISPNLMRIRLDPTRVDSRFAMYSITLGRDAQRQIEEMAGNAGRRVVSSAVLRHLLLSIPPIAEQKEIARIGRHIEERMAAESDALEALESAKSALLPALLTGEIRIPLDSPPA